MKAFLHKIVTFVSLLRKGRYELIFQRMRVLGGHVIDNVVLLFSKVDYTKEGLIIYLVPGGVKINGGVMSIFNQSVQSRHLMKNYAVIVSTYPSAVDYYVINKEFPNNEVVWRWSKVSKNINRFDKVYLHIPEYYAPKFMQDLSEGDVKVLKKVRDLRINIMDQNIWLMPSREHFAGLYDLTDKVSQTVAHTKYATQEFADKFGLPTLLLWAFWAMEVYPVYPFEKKEKCIVYSPDEHPRKKEILDMLRYELPDFELVEVRNLKFNQFMDLVARSMFSLTFGEGLDGYFSNPLIKKSLSFAVYNSDFFSADVDWSNVWTVFKDYDDLRQNLVKKIRLCAASGTLYSEKLNEVRHLLKIDERTDALGIERLRNGLKRFYCDDFDYYPRSNHDQSIIYPSRV